MSIIYQKKYDRICKKKAEISVGNANKTKNIKYFKKSVDNNNTICYNIGT